jgi:hypothetical protein
MVSTEQFRIVRFAAWSYLFPFNVHLLRGRPHQCHVPQVRADQHITLSAYFMLPRYSPFHSGPLNFLYAWCSRSTLTVHTTPAVCEIINLYRLLHVNVSVTL